MAEFWILERCNISFRLLVALFFLIGSHGFGPTSFFRRATTGSPTTAETRRCAHNRWGRLSDASHRVDLSEPRQQQQKEAARSITKGKEMTAEGVVEGPDLNPSRSPLDRKLYRQIILPNGLRCVLISDIVAMQQDIVYDEDDEEDEENEETTNQGKEEYMKAKRERYVRRARSGQDGDEDDEDDEEEEEDDDDDDEMDGTMNAAAAMAVGVGSVYDPPEAQGLAHFMEHMLYMGNKKYPTENALEAFLAKHGGFDNAFTEMEYTVYTIETPQEKLFDSLDHFAQCFIHPLLLEDAVEREMKSIDSEFQLIKNSDSCRVEQLMCYSSGNTPTSNPFSMFSWGNLKTLKETPEKNQVDIMGLLRRFYNQYYYALNMRLVVVGAYTLDELQKVVVGMFSPIPSEAREVSTRWPVQITDPGTWQQKIHSPMASLGLPFQQSSLKYVHRIVPVRDRHTVSITWQLPSQMKNWKSKPDDYLSHLLGHESHGSIYSSLRSKSWVTGCYAGVGDDGVEFASSHALFNFSLTLSKEGMKNWMEVIEYVYLYIGMLRHYCQHGGLPEWIFEELRLLQEVSYKYGDDEPSDDLVERLAVRLAPPSPFPPERLLDGQDLLFEYDGNAVQDILDNYMTPANARIDLMSSTFGRASDYDDNAVRQAPRNGEEEMESEDGTFQVETAGPPYTEPMFGTKYWRRTLLESTLKSWNQAFQAKMPSAESSLALPIRNRFVPEKFDLKPLPPDDSHHPLLNSSLKLCIPVGKRKAWFPATVVKFNSIKNQVLLSYEDEDEKWHKMDLEPAQLTTVMPDFESTLDGKSVKFRVVALAKDGEGAILKYGDETDYQVEEGGSFPAIAPPLAESRLPKLVCNTQILKLWHLQDRKFKRPIADLRVRLVCVAAGKTTLHQACAELFVDLCVDAVTETIYYASVAEAGMSIAANDADFTIQVNGFDDKLLELFQVVFEVVLSFRGRGKGEGLPDCVGPGRFEACLEILRRRYENDGIKASRLSSDVRIRCLRPNTASAYAMSQALQDLQIDTFTEVMSDILNKFAVEALFHGNVDRSDAEKVQKLILGHLRKSQGCGLPRKKYPALPVSKIPKRPQPFVVTVPAKDPSEPNTAVEVYFQVGKDNIEERVLTDIFTHIMYEPFHDQVRTKDQFGYHVMCDSRWTYGVTGMYFSVVSSVKTAAEITARIEKFLQDFRAELDKMTQQEFLEHIVGLAKNKLDIFHSMSEETDCYWEEIVDGRYEWQVYRDEVVILRSITKDRLLQAWDDWLSPEGRRMLVVQVLRPSEDSASGGSPPAIAVDERVASFHKSVGKSTWGKIY